MRAITMPASTKTQIATWVQIQNGDIRRGRAW